MARIRLVTSSCRRCGRAVSTLNRPIHASRQTFNRYRAICDACMPEEEQRECVDAIARDILRGKK
jgi:hypothetical protein